MSVIANGDAINSSLRAKRSNPVLCSEFWIASSRFAALAVLAMTVPYRSAAGFDES